MPVIDEGVLDDKLAVLERAREWSPRTIAKFEALLQSPDDYTVLRMNPLAFARERGIAPAEALDLFLHAARGGLVTMDWHLLCPLCGAAVQSFASLRTLQCGFFCSLCMLQAEANLDDFIQVSFTAAPGVRRLRFHDVESLTAEDFLYQLRFTREMHFGSLDGPRMRDMLPKFINVLTWVQPGARVPFGFDVDGPGAFSAAEFQAHTGVNCEVREDGASSTIDFDIQESALVATATTLRPGHIAGYVTNHRSYPVVFAVSFKPAAMLLGSRPDTVLEPMVTGATLLTNTTFRRLFRSETVSGVEGIGVRDVTVLFTDLKSSTALYERIGDLRAFSLVQQHFDRLGAVVQANAGAIVKTIGDAVMAAFQRPADAVRAAFEMHDQIDAFNREHGARDVVLKIGIHRGPSIAVTLNGSLDYFGHTVNVAARVQGLADADEIFVTDDVYRGDGVAALLARVESHDASLRGLHTQVRVHKAVRG